MNLLIFVLLLVLSIFNVNSFNNIQQRQFISEEASLEERYDNLVVINAKTFSNFEYNYNITYNNRHLYKYGEIVKDSSLSLRDGTNSKMALMTFYFVPLQIGHTIISLYINPKTSSTRIENSNIFVKRFNLTIY